MNSVIKEILANLGDVSANWTSVHGGRVETTVCKLVLVVSEKKVIESLSEERMHGVEMRMTKEVVNVGSSENDGLRN